MTDDIEEGDPIPEGEDEGSAPVPPEDDASTQPQEDPA